MASERSDPSSLHVMIRRRITSAGYALIGYKTRTTQFQGDDIRPIEITNVDATYDLITSGFVGTSGGGRTH